MKLEFPFGRTVMSMSVASLCLTGCFEEEQKVRIDDIEGELKILAFDESRAKEFVAKLKVELVEHEKAVVDVGRAVVIGKQLEELTQELETLTSESDELNASLESTLSDVEQHRADYRTKIRKEIVGKEVDLSKTKGEGFENVRVLSVTPLGIRIYTTTGPQSVAAKDIPSDLKERLLMDDEEIQIYREKQAANAEFRAKKYADWKEGLGERQKKATQDKIVQRLKDIQAEIESLEKVINRRINKIKNLRSRASQWERNWSKEYSKGRKAKAEKYYQYYRDQAQLVSDENASSWLVIFRLREEMEDLKALVKPLK